MRRSELGRGATRFVAAAAAFGAVVTTGCELTGVLVERPEDVIFAETWAIVRADADGPVLDAFAFLHRSVGATGPGLVSGASVRLSGESGGVVHLAEQDAEVCVHVPEFVWPKHTGTCYRTRMSPSPFAPDERLALEIETPDGRLLVSASRVPGMFSFQDLTQEGGSCRLEPGTNFRFEWTGAEEAWAYLVGARIEGLPEAFEDEEFEVPDSLHLGGPWLGPQETAIVFPRHFGLLEFLSNEHRDLIRALQDGLPEGARAEVAFTATDRNWANWVRGETLDPTWPRRIPSVSGDGTGWFGTAAQRRVEVWASSHGEALPPLCGPAYAAQPAGLSRGSRNRAGPSPKEGQ